MWGLIQRTELDFEALRYLNIVDVQVIEDDEILLPNYLPPIKDLQKYF